MNDFEFYKNIRSEIKESRYIDHPQEWLPKTNPLGTMPVVKSIGTKGVCDDTLVRDVVAKGAGPRPLGGKE